MLLITGAERTAYAKGYGGQGEALAARRGWGPG